MSRHDTQALQAANRAFYAAFEALDFDAMSACWARSVDISCVHPGWDILTGLEPVLQSWRDIFASTSEMRFRISDPAVTVQGDAGWVVCREVLFTTVQGSPVENVLTAVNTFVREQGEWRIAHHHAAPIMAGRPRTRQKPEPPRTLH